MSKRKDGGPAFPWASNSSDGHVGQAGFNPGMSRRDYFAGQALAGWLASTPADYPYTEDTAKSTAKVCYEFADAMLAASHLEGSDQPVPLFDAMGMDQPKFPEPHKKEEL